MVDPIWMIKTLRYTMVVILTPIVSMVVGIPGFSYVASQNCMGIVVVIGVIEAIDKWHKPTWSSYQYKPPTIKQLVVLSSWRSSSWWFQPISQNGNLPQAPSRGENTKCLKPPSSHIYYSWGGAKTYLHCGNHLRGKQNKAGRKIRHLSGPCPTGKMNSLENVPQENNYT